MQPVLQFSAGSVVYGCFTRTAPLRVDCTAAVAELSTRIGSAVSRLRTPRSPPPYLDFRKYIPAFLSAVVRIVQYLTPFFCVPNLMAPTLPFTVIDPIYATHSFIGIMSSARNLRMRAFGWFGSVYQAQDRSPWIMVPTHFHVVHLHATGTAFTHRRPVLVHMSSVFEQAWIVFSRTHAFAPFARTRTYAHAPCTTTAPLPHGDVVIQASDGCLRWLNSVHLLDVASLD